MGDLISKLLDKEFIDRLGWEKNKINDGIEPVKHMQPA